MIGNDVLRTVARWIASARGMIARAVVRGVDDAGRTQRAQVDVLAGETRTAERIGTYGFTSHPRPGSPALVVFVGGDRGAPVILGVEDASARLRDLAAGEVAIYTDEGDSIVLRRGHVVEIRTNTLRVVGDLEVTGDVTASGDVADGTRAISADRAIYNAHTHAGVQSGSSTTAPPVPQE